MLNLSYQKALSKELETDREIVAEAVKESGWVALEEVSEVEELIRSWWGAVINI